MKNLLKLFLAVLIIAAMGFTAKADQKVSETQLPASAQSFLKKHYASVKVIECEKDGAKYDVELRGGIDLEFTADGKLLKIDAGSKKVPVAITTAFTSYTAPVWVSTDLTFLSSKPILTISACFM